MLWFLAAKENNETNPTPYQGPLEYAAATLQYILGLLPPEGWTALFTAALFFGTLALWNVTGIAARAAKTARIAVPIDKIAYASIKSRNSRLHLHGTIYFSDYTGSQWEQPFMLIWNPESKRFAPWGQRARRKKQPEG